MAIDKNIVIRSFTKPDISSLMACFKKNNWKKPKRILEVYLQEQIDGKRVVWVAQIKSEIAGYVTLLWESRYEGFRINSIPEIVDLNVFPPFRNQGIGSMLIKTAELFAATKHMKVGIGVGLYGGLEDGYGAAQRLYVKFGYIPDGAGITYKHKWVSFGKRVTINDELILWLYKELK